MTWKIVNLVLFLCAAGCCVFWFWKAVSHRAAYVMLGRTEQPARLDRMRLREWAAQLFGHKKLLKDRRSGLMHLVIFYGFIVLQIGAIDIVWNGLFGVRLPLPAYEWFVLSQEIAVTAVLLAILYAGFRRYVEKLRRLKRDWKPSIVLFFIGGLMISVLFVSAFERIWKEEPASALAPIGSMLAAAMDGFIAVPAGEALYYAAWWAHLLLLLAFLVYIPQSKHFHLLTAPVNLALARSDPPGKLRTLDLEDEEAETFGVGAIEQFSRKQLLDLYACVECGRCTDVCPAAGTGKLLSPMHLIVKLRDHLTEKGAAITSKTPWVPTFAFGANGTAVSAFRPEPKESRVEWIGEGITDIGPTMKRQKESWLRTIADRSDEQDNGGEQHRLAMETELIGHVMTAEELWACTTCRNCEDQCPVGNEHVDKIIDMRRYLVLTEGNVPGDGQRALQNIERQGNPWGISRSDRDKWLDDLDGVWVPTVREQPDFDYLFFVGSMGSYDNRTRKVTIATVKLMAHAGVRFAILGAEEKNSGDTPRRMGNELLFRQCCDENIALFRKYKVRKIVTACPHTYNTFKHEYPEFGLKAEVVHHTELLALLLQERKLVPSYPVREVATYHDSCYLGRYNGGYDAPRAILRAIPELSLEEMERSGANAMCCGAGGGLMWMEEKAGKRINVARVEQALATAPTVIASACPYCLTMMEDGTKLLEAEERVAAKDVSELLAAAVFGPH
ncbi:(Fe-S)-binding protein [Paenibacillus hemerocallicola]|uniref:(Fe-S)-binding protein n=1 Tax=Paenibacillus hemerocallicola TaxID=1172614 RepID=A0A5C4TH23_9BACL|nr:(Fe-S)-binding protein [Paenibacillus hemerocallicola]TNJ68278.1 (Fe-S)-binding protein [Paenibacillus hemerocallicola]